MNYDDHTNQNLDIEPALILLGIGYASMLFIAISWTAALVI